MKIVRRWLPTRTQSAQSDDSDVPAPSVPQSDGSPDWVTVIVMALSEAAKSWGATIRLVVILLAVGAVALLLGQAVPWEVLAGVVGQKR